MNGMLQLFEQPSKRGPVAGQDPENLRRIALKRPTAPGVGTLYRHISK